MTAFHLSADLVGVRAGPPTRMWQWQLLGRCDPSRRMFCLFRLSFLEFWPSSVLNQSQAASDVFDRCVYDVSNCVLEFEGYIDVEVGGLALAAVNGDVVGVKIGPLGSIQNGIDAALEPRDVTGPANRD